MAGEKQQKKQAGKRKPAAGKARRGPQQQRGGSSCDSSDSAVSAFPYSPGTSFPVVHGTPADNLAPAAPFCEFKSEAAFAPGPVTSTHDSTVFFPDRTSSPFNLPLTPAATTLLTQQNLMTPQSGGGGKAKKAGGKGACSSGPL